MRVKEFVKFDPVSQNVSLPNEYLEKTGALLARKYLM